MFAFYLLSVFGFFSGVQAQQYRPVKGWSTEINDQLKSFLNATIMMKERKVPVFDCDGTTFLQVSHYLADEALYQYTDEVLKKRNDKEAKEKLAILDRTTQTPEEILGDLGYNLLITTDISLI